ncbi:MAG: hypothetical protein GX914_06505 [Erysipelotrichia bacterium]|nr:hypothetical protein [Erysipelotrichia bacterium]
MIIRNNKKLKRVGFKNERELQNFFEENLNEILNIDFVSSEFSVDKYRIDTVGYEPDKNAFRIIEYKNVKNNSLVDQGYAYLNLLHTRKADFVLNYNEVTGDNLRISEVDWTQSRIIFVSTHFSNYQIDATSFKNMPFDLWEVEKFEDEIISIENKSKRTNIAVDDFVSDSAKETLKEIIVYDEAYHLNNKPEEIQDIYNVIKSRILELGEGEIDIDPRKLYIAFKGSTNIVDIEVQQKQLKIHLNMKKGTLNDPENLTIDQSNIGRWGNGDYRIDLNNLENIEYIMYLFKQSYEVNR